MKFLIFRKDIVPGNRPYIGVTISHDSKVSLLLTLQVHPYKNVIVCIINPCIQYIIKDYLMFLNMNGKKMIWNHICWEWHNWGLSLYKVLSKVNILKLMHGWQYKNNMNVMCLIFGHVITKSWLTKIMYRYQVTAFNLEKQKTGSIISNVELNER